jgi:hypothetical protein
VFAQGKGQLGDSRTWDDHVTMLANLRRVGNVSDSTSQE